MEKIQITFGKDKTGIIKGVAIIFMIVLHVFGGSGWYEECYDLPVNHNAWLMNFMQSFQICVGIFVFMIGYGYAFSKSKDFTYSVKHIKQLLMVFWCVILLLALPVSYNSIEGKSLIYNLLGIEETISWVSWFIFLYIWAMIIMPFICRLIDCKSYLWSGLCAIASWGAMVVVHYFVPNFSQYDLWRVLFVCLGWTPTIILGYLFAKEKLFQRIQLSNHWMVTAFAVIMIVVVLFAKSIFHGISILNADIVYATVIITCILVIFSQSKLPWFSKILIELGNKSVYMWFIHALFFTAATRPAYQHFVMISDNLCIVCLWTIVLSYLLSIPLKKLVEL